MSKKQATDIPFWQRNLKKTWVRICCFAVLLLAVILIVLPHAVRIGLERWLLDNGADQASISKIEINLFTGESSLQGVDVVLGGKTVLANSNIYLNLGLRSLFTHEALVQRAILHNVIIDIEQYEDGRWRFGSIYTKGKTEAKEPAAETDQSWFFASNQLELIDSTIHYTQPRLEASLFVEKALLVKFSTGPTEKSGSLTFKGQLNDAPLALQLDTLRIAPELKISGTVKTSDLLLDNLAGLVEKSFKPFSGRIGSAGTFNFHLTRDHKIVADYDGNIDLEGADIAGQGYAVKGKHVDWNGQVIYRQEKSRTMALDLDGSVKGVELMLNLPDRKIDLQQDLLEVQSKTSIAVDQEVSVNSEGKITLGDTDFTMPPYQVQNKNLSWQGSAFFTSAGQNVRINGALALKNPLYLQTEENTSLSAGSDTMSWQGLVEYVGERKQKPQNILNLKGELDGTSIYATLPGPDLHFSQDSLTLTGGTTLPLNDARMLQGDAELQTHGLLLTKNSTGEKLFSIEELFVDGLQAPAGLSLTVDKVRAEQLEFLKAAAPALQLTIPEITLNNFSTETMESFSLQELSAHALLAEKIGTDKHIFSIEGIRISDIETDKTLNLTAEELSVNNAQVFEQKIEDNENNFLQFAELTVDKPKWSNNKNLQITNINLNDLDVNILKDENGLLLISKSLQELGVSAAEDAPMETAAEPAEDKSASPFTYQIAEITVTGKSGLRFEDHALKLPFIADLSFDTLRITDLDSAEPEKAASFELNGHLDKYAPLAVHGAFKPVPGNLSLHQTASLKNYPMIRLAPYSIQYLGITPTQGTLNVESELSLENGHLNLEKTWLLKKLEIKTVDNELAGKFNGQLPMPLDSALSILKDKNENIELAIPISGPVDHLDFGISGLFITPLSKAIVSASSSYLIYALGPYAAAAYVGLKLGEKLMETKLPAVEFEPGEKILTDEHKKYLERIAEILNNRPKIDLQLCPHVLPAEHLFPSKQHAKKEQSAEPLPIEGQEEKKEQPVELSENDKKALLQLGNARALAIKDYLVLVHDIDPGRLLVCLPQPDENKDAVPRVDLKI
ncbi:MAG: DUF748 domain-containing protein [Desulfobulbaceae bacterium]|nr:DUF748 domain-containing protein [Desulfobulbaceae bacterium]